MNAFVKDLFLETSLDMRPSFTDDLMNYIMEHDNRSVKDFLESNKANMLLLYSSMYTNPPALSMSVGADNLQATCLLLEHGWEDGTSTALEETMAKSDYSKAMFLVSLGFQQSCDDCYDCGWPNTCSLTDTMTSYDESSQRSRGDLDFWCRSQDEDDVAQAFSRYLVHDNFNEAIASRIVHVVVSTGNFSLPCTFPLTELNSAFVLSLSDRGIVDVSRQAHRVVIEMLECIYTIDPSASTRAAFLFRMLKKLVDMGACVDTKLDVEETYMLPLVLPGLDPGRKLSVRDVAGGFGVEDRDIRRLKRIYSRHPHVKMVAEYMKLSMEYIRFKCRSGFIAKRLRGFDEWENPGYLANKLVEMPPELFGRIMMFVI